MDRESRSTPLATGRSPLGDGEETQGYWHSGDPSYAGLAPESMALSGPKVGFPVGTSEIPPGNSVGGSPQLELQVEAAA